MSIELHFIQILVFEIDQVGSAIKLVDTPNLGTSTEWRE